MGLALVARRGHRAQSRRSHRAHPILLWIAVAFATGMVGAVVYLQKAGISPHAASGVAD
jgi:branched-chain amino acid transport system permease protein